jgi:hypothetical protein
MPVGWKRLINVDESLRYSLGPLERVSCPFKKHEFNDFKKKYLNENGIIETLEGNAYNYNAIPSGNSTNTKNKYRLRIYFKRAIYSQ